MKTFIFLLLLCGIFTISYSQTIKPIPSNPSPRVGESFSIDSDIDYPEKFNLQNLTKQYSTIPAVVKGCSADNYFAKGSLMINKSFNDTGTVCIGPFTFNIDGKEY